MSLNLNTPGDRNKFFTILGVLLLLIMIPVTLSFLPKEQDVRTRASTLNTTTITPSVVENASLLTPTEIPPASSSGITFAVTVYFPGIGKSGDNATTSGTLGNARPLHPKKPFTLEMYNASNDLVATTDGTLTFDSVNGYFSGTATATINSGTYKIKIVVKNYLKKLFPANQTLSLNQTTKLPTVTLIAGDLNGDNILDVKDTNIMLNCYSSLAPAKSCTDDQKQIADLDDDGKVDQIDYNLLLRELSAKKGD